MDINGRYTQRDVDDAYDDWKRAAKKASVGGTPVVEAFWQRYCRIDDAFASQGALAGSEG